MNQKKPSNPQSAQPMPGHRARAQRLLRPARNQIVLAPRGHTIPNALRTGKAA